MDYTIGQKFNRLTIIGETDKKTKNRSKILICKCDCGTIKEIAKDKLRKGTKSCGCLKRENLTKYEIGAAHRNWEGHGNISKSFFSRIEACAKLRKYNFELTIEDLWKLFLKQDGKCALTGTQLELPINIRKLRDKTDQRLASLDRIDNSKGYTQDNVRWICKRLNYMKHTISDIEFLSWVKEVYQYNFKD